MINITTYITMAVLIFLYAYLIGGPASILMLYMLIGAPLISLLLTISVRRKIDVSVKIPSVEIEKGGKAIVEVFLENKSWLPIPFIDIVFRNSINFTLSDLPIISVSLGPFKSKTVSMEYTAVCRGIVPIGVEAVELRGYLGILKLSLLNYIGKLPKLKEISIMPRIFNINATMKTLTNSTNLDASAQHGEEVIKSFNNLGEAGYEVREYSAGDPLHKIHWKLSAKRDVFMVRKDEGAAEHKKYLILDPYMRTETAIEGRKESFISKILYDSSDEEEVQHEETSLIQEKLLEVLLSVVNSIVHSENEAVIYIFEKRRWIPFEVQNFQDISKLQHRLASYEFEDISTFQVKERLPLNYLLKNTGRTSGMEGRKTVIFTANMDKALSDILSNCKSCNLNINTLYIQQKSDDGRKVQNSDGLWVIDAKRDLSEAF